MKKIIKYLFYGFINVFCIFSRIFIWKTKKIWIFGSWMGLKFADNSRYLFQYLHDNKGIYGIKKVVWITRNKNLLKTLKSLGYITVYANSLLSFYYHLRAGVHVICNMPCGNKDFKGDICGMLSIGSVKIQCWHGIPLKANLKNDSDRLKNNFIYRFLQPGHWESKQIICSTGKGCTSRMIKWFGTNYNYLECGYPRLCNCVKLMGDEQVIIGKISTYKKVILYLPTFRSNQSSFVHPLCNEDLCEFLNDNAILWIEKPHQANKGNELFLYDRAKIKNIVELKPEFDINTIIKYISILATDFSSVSLDALYFKKPVVYYAPDLEEYMRRDRGFLDDFKDLMLDSFCMNSYEFLEKIKSIYRGVYFNTNISAKYSYLIELLYSNGNIDYHEIMGSMMTKIRGLKQK